MYKDIISYELAEGITEAHLLEVTQKVVTTWMQQQAGFIRWEIHKNKDGAYVDILYWENKEAAKKAEQDMANISNAAEWYACYKQESISSKNLTRLASF